ncbi:hypothetical protein [Streptosporangium sp. NPDC051022]|uniref:hypothetical protein n=1 Tax=Streptosporangium sp. NPDC051022 TaxID=3155752 RepID=UPI00343F5312
MFPYEEPAKQQAEEEEQQQLQVQVTAAVPAPPPPPAPAHALPVFQVDGDFHADLNEERARVTTSVIRGQANIDRRVVGVEIGTDLGWVQTMFRARMQADYYTEGGYARSLILQTTEPVIDGNDNNDIWYGDPRRFDHTGPFIGTVFDDSPQFVAPALSPEGDRLVRLSGSWTFGCWLVTRSQNLRSKFLYHQDWTASFHAEVTPEGLALSYSDLTLGDAGAGPGTLHPLMDGPPSSTFLDDQGTWRVLAEAERLDQDGMDLT